MKRISQPLRLASLVALAAVLAACGGGSDNNDRGAVKSTTQTAALPKAAIDASVAAQPGFGQLIGAASKCDVSVNRLIYDTRDTRDNDAEASAGVLIPSGCPGPYPILVYHHGTTVLKSFTMCSFRRSSCSYTMVLRLLLSRSSGSIMRVSGNTSPFNFSA